MKNKQHNLYKQTTQPAIVWPISTRHFDHVNTGFLHRVEHCSTPYQISVPEKIV